jgi:hypothetical protein
MNNFHRPNSQFIYSTAPSYKVKFQLQKHQKKEELPKNRDPLSEPKEKIR